MVKLQEKKTVSPQIEWKSLPEDFVLPDDPVESQGLFHASDGEELGY